MYVAFISHRQADKFVFETEDGCLYLKFHVLESNTSFSEENYSICIRTRKSKLFGPLCLYLRSWPKLSKGWITLCSR